MNSGNQNSNLKTQSYNQKFKMILGFCILVLIFALSFLIWSSGRKNYAAGALDDFAKCLAERGITMYGAEWCPHCQNEKKAFGSSFKFVPYVECPENPQVCLSAGIEGYPTWIFMNGERLVGEQGVQKLSEESGCTLPTKP